MQRPSTQQSYVRLAHAWTAHGDASASDAGKPSMQRYTSFRQDTVDSSMKPIKRQASPSLYRSVDNKTYSHSASENQDENMEEVVAPAGLGANEDSESGDHAHWRGRQGGGVPGASAVAGVRFGGGPCLVGVTRASCVEGFVYGTTPTVKSPAGIKSQMS